MIVPKLPMLAAAFAVGMAAPAHGQATANATEGAADAFGYKKGDESVGIYDEFSVRGFNLEVAGNYRVNGTYFVRNSGVSSFFLDSTTVRVGHNTLGSLLPGPLGLVDYRLRDPAQGEPSLVTFERDTSGGLHADFHYKHRSKDERASYSLGLGLVANLGNEQGGDGGRSLLVGGATRQQLGSAIARLFGGEYQYRRPSRFRVIPGLDALPPDIERGRYIGQPWSMEEGQRRIAGILVDHGESEDFGVGGTLVFSQEDPTRGFRQFLSDVGPNGTARITMLAIPQQRSTSWSGELRAHRQWSAGRTKHRLDLMVRGRRSRARLGGSQVIDLGRAPFGDPAAPAPEPDMSGAAAQLHDRVDQWGVGIAYRTVIGDRLSINSGLLRTDYRKIVDTGADRSSSRVKPWLYNVGVSWQPLARLDLYATYSRGLVEAGVTPANAANRDTVLPAVEAKQAELGLRYRIGDALTLVLGAFDTRKPYIGIDGNSGIYGELGRVRHRGVELSLAGKPMTSLSVVLGGVLLDPRIDGPLVDAGQIGVRPVAVPRLRAIANVDYALPGIKGLSIDAGLTHVASRPAHSLPGVAGEQLTVPSMTKLDLGLRYRFALAQRPLIVRAQILNITDEFDWDVDSSESLTYSAPRQARVALTAEF